jgi:hypothetical protein
MKDETVFVVLPFVVAVSLGLGFWAVFRQRASMRRAGAARPPRARADIPAPARPQPLHRPWWAHPALWMAVSATFLLLGIFVTPRLLGGVVIFLPFLWIGGWPRSRPPRPDPSRNGSRSRDPRS